MEDIFQEFPGLWAVVVYGQNQKCIGRILHDAGLDPSVDQQIDAADKEAFETGHVVMQPIYEYHSALVPTQDGNLSREVLAFPFDLCSNIESKISIKPTLITWFDRLEVHDAQQYKNVVLKADEMRQATNVQKSGIVRATQMPDLRNTKMPDLRNLKR